MRPEDFKGKKVLVFGLGLLGGGVATTNWLLDQGAEVTVTDLKTEEQLKASLSQITGPVTLKLGGHDEADIVAADVIVLNPDVPHSNPFVQKAFVLGKQIENEASLFYTFCPRPIIGITGTRGKTTTTTWTNYFLGQQFRSVVAGNSPESQFLKILPQVSEVQFVVTEMPSFHLELFDRVERGPDIAVITNIFRDHIPWHGSQEAYTRAKAKLFSHQTKHQHLILNKDNEWTQFLLDLKPQSRVWFFGKESFVGHGLYYHDGAAYFRAEKSSEKVLDLEHFIEDRGEHNLENLLAAALAAHLSGVPWEKIQAAITNLPQVKFRQEVIFKDQKLTIINDTTATSPEGAIAAMKRFASPTTVLIAGGTDKNLEFSGWAEAVTRYIKAGNLILIGGSATDKMIAALQERSFGGSNQDVSVCETLADCVTQGLAKARAYESSVLLFSPGAKSFEKFQNEFDRGQQFNALIREAVGE